MFSVVLVGMHVSIECGLRWCLTVVTVQVYAVFDVLDVDLGGRSVLDP